jgi:hypothetical protein
MNEHAANEHQVDAKPHIDFEAQYLYHSRIIQKLGRWLTRLTNSLSDDITAGNLNFNPEYKFD